MAYSTNSPAGQAVQSILDALPSLMAVAVVDIQSGMALASHSNAPGLNPDTAAAYNTEVVKQKQKAMTALKLQGERIDDILISLSDQHRTVKAPAVLRQRKLLVKERGQQRANFFY